MSNIKNKTKIGVLKCLTLLVIFLVVSCQPKQGEIMRSLEWSAEPAPQWTTLFKRTDGWFGGDGIFFIPSIVNGRLNRSKQLILFSDTMIGTIREGKIDTGFHMVNNSIAQLNGEEPHSGEINFPLPQTNGKEVSLFPVKLDSIESDEYYWLGDGFTNSHTSKRYIFAYRVVNRYEWVDALFKFEVLGGALIILPAESNFPFVDQYQIELPFFKGVNDGHISFGAGIFENTIAHGAQDPDGFIYIYGIRDPGKQLVVARAREESFENLDSWQFFDGQQWQSDFEQSAAISDSVSNELSVTELINGRFALVFQINGVNAKVGMRLGDSPIGPFDPIEEIWDCSEALEKPEFFAYNAKAHPSISKPGELLISYNVNSFAFWDQINDHPQLYRPRFFRLSFH